MLGQLIKPIVLERSSPMMALAIVFYKYIGQIVGWIPDFVPILCRKIIKA